MYSIDSRVRYSEVDYEGRMTITSVLDYFQDCSTFHSEELEVGLAYLKQEEIAWILASWQIIVERYPEHGERIKISTWPHDFKGFYGYRNFLMTDEAGGRLAYANTNWVLLDTKSGRPIRVLPSLQEAYQIEPALTMKCESRKIKVPKELEHREIFQVQKYHLDTNHHVNNGKYILMAQEYLPEGFRIGQLRAEYRKAAVYGDCIFPSVAIEQNKVTVILGDKEHRPYAIVELEEAQ